MREIKFRVWCKQTETMHFVLKMGFNEGELWYVEDEDHKTQPPYLVGNDDWELMQCTGIKDYTENEIFEGDILEDLATNKKYEVIWDDFAGMFLFNPLRTEGEGMDYYEFESTVGMTTILVIGNIYENEGLK